MSDFSKRDKELLAAFGMTEEQVERDAAIMEDENADHGIVGPVYYGSHLREEFDEPLTSMTVKLPKSQLDRITEAARRCHISRSEYVRRKLATV